MRRTNLVILGLLILSGAAHAQNASHSGRSGSLGVVLGNLPLTNSQNLAAGQLWDQGVRSVQQSLNPNTQSYAISNGHASMRASSSSSTGSTTTTTRSSDGRSGTRTETNSGQNTFDIWGTTRFDTVTKNGIGSAWGYNSGNVASSAGLNNGGSAGATTSVSSNSNSSSNATTITGGGVRR
jgi:hypothetical protein